MSAENSFEKGYEEDVNNLKETNPEIFDSEDVDDFDSYEQLDEPDDYSAIDDLPTDDDVLKLTEYDGNLGTNTGVSVVAEYKDIDVVNVSVKHQKLAKNFVDRVLKFVLDFGDIELTDTHRAYVKSVGAFQLENLVDMMSLVTINKGMIDNIVRRVNSTQAEDYAMIQTYNNLVNLHIKLSKELQNTYKSIPTTIKKMRAEVLCDQELGAPIDSQQGGLPQAGDEINGEVTENFGITQFNNTKHLLKQLREKHDREKAEKAKE